MTPKLYQEFVAMGTNPSKFGTTYDERAPLILGALGLAGEAAEVLEHFNRFVLYGEALDIKAVRLELGDVLWYAQLISNTHDLDMNAMHTIFPPSASGKPPVSKGLFYATSLSVCAGNIADVFKKHLLHNKSLDKESLQWNLSLVVGYIEKLAVVEADTDIIGVMEANVDKLCERFGHDRSKWLPAAK